MTEIAREEKHVVSALVTLCESVSVGCVVQVGAGDGYEAWRISQATGARAIAVDADERCGPCSEGIEFHNYLIGATDCIAAFFRHPTPGLSSTLPRGDHEERVDLKQVRLDTFCAAHGIAPDALIIDTEGTTLDVLEGAESVLSNVRIVYAEAQTVAIRSGMRLVTEIDAFLSLRGFTAHEGPPSYDGGAQGNYTWVRP